MPAMPTACWYAASKSWRTSSWHDRSVVGAGAIPTNMGRTWTLYIGGARVALRGRSGEITGSSRPLLENVITAVCQMPQVRFDGTGRDRAVYRRGQPASHRHPPAKRAEQGTARPSRNWQPIWVVDASDDGSKLPTYWKRWATSRRLKPPSTADQLHHPCLSPPAQTHFLEGLVQHAHGA